MKNKLVLLFTFIFTFAVVHPVYASNMGFKKVFIDPNAVGGFIWEDVDKETEHVLNKNVLALNKLTDLLIKSSGENSNNGREITLQQHIAQMNMQFLALQNETGYFVGSIDNPNNNTFQSVKFINTAFNHILLADLNSDFTGLLMADLNYDIASAQIIFLQNNKGVAQVGLQVVGSVSGRTIVYTYDNATGNMMQSYDTTAFDNLISDVQNIKGDAFSGLNVNPF